MKTQQKYHFIAGLYSRSAAKRGFTLVEIVVSFAILALIGVTIAAAVTGMTGIKIRESDLREGGYSAESSIAGEGDPTASRDLDIGLGGYAIPGSADTHESGLGSYTILNPGAEAIPPTIIVDGATSTRYREYTVQRTGYYEMELWGAAGGNGLDRSTAATNNINPGGAGGYSFGIVHLEKGDVIHIYAGGAGAQGLSTETVQGGANGGGTSPGGTHVFNPMNYMHGSGGGASDIRIKENSLSARVIVAGGGGGGGGNPTLNAYVSSAGGAGGGTNGSDGALTGYQMQNPDPNHINSNYWRTPGTAGTMSSGGIGGRYQRIEGTLGENGSFGQGGSSGNYPSTQEAAPPGHGGAGGGGWYGGGGAGACGPGGGGGSGWVLTQDTYQNWTDTAEKANYTLVDNGDSDYWLQKTSMINGDNPSIPPIPRDSSTDITPGAEGGGYVIFRWHGTSVS